MSALLAGLGPALEWVLPALAAIGAVAAAWLSGSRSARNKAERDALARRVDASGVRNEVDRDIGRGADGAAADELRKDWRRGGGV